MTQQFGIDGGLEVMWRRLFEVHTAEVTGNRSRQLFGFAFRRPGDACSEIATLAIQPRAGGCRLETILLEEILVLLAEPLLLVDGV